MERTIGTEHEEKRMEKRTWQKNGLINGGVCTVQHGVCCEENREWRITTWLQCGVVKKKQTKKPVDRIKYDIEEE